MKYLDEEKNVDGDDPFKPEIVVQKMKKIKKTKKKSNNYKNIEPLTNIYEQEYENPITEEQKGPVIQEGLSQDGIANFKEDDYTGKDDIYEGGDSSSRPADILTDIINKCYNFLHSIPLEIAIGIIEGIEEIGKVAKLSDNTSTRDKAHDQQVIARYIGWTFCIIISTYAIYNWFYIIGYKNEKKEAVELPVIFDRKLIYNKGVFDPTFKLIHYFFQHSIFFPEYLQKGIIMGSEKLRATFNPSFIYSMLFFLIIFVFYHSLSFIRNILIAIVTINMKNLVLSFMLSMISVLLMISFFTPPIKINLETWEDVKILGPSVMAQMGELVSNINPITGIMNLVICFFYILFVLFFGTPIALLLCMGYLFAYTFFGIALLKSFNFEEIKELSKKIPTYARSEKGKIKKESFCVRLTFWEKIINFVHGIFDVMYKYCFEIAIVYMLTFGIYDYWYNLRLRNVRLTMFTSAIVFLTSILAVVYLRIQKENQEESIKGKSVPVPVPAPVPVPVPVQ